MQPVSPGNLSSPSNFTSYAKRGTQHQPQQTQTRLPAFTGKKPNQEIHAITAAAIQQINTTSRQPAALPQLLSELQNRFGPAEKYYLSITTETEKSGMAECLRETHHALVRTILNIAQQQSDTQLFNQPFFTQTTVGKLAVATYLHADTAHTLPSTLYSPDIMSAQTPIVVALYPTGLLQAADTNLRDTRTLSMTDKLTHLAQFTDVPGTTHPLSSYQTYPAKWVDEQKESILTNSAAIRFQDYPTLTQELKKGLAEKIDAKLASDSNWITSLNGPVTGTQDKQWQHQFEGLENELFDGLCLYLDRVPSDNNLEITAFAMSVAEVCDTPNTYKRVISKGMDKKLAALIGNNAPADIKAMIQKNPQWRAAIGGRLDSIHEKAKNEAFKTALAMTLPLPKEAKNWVPKTQKMHLVTPKNMVAMLKKHTIPVNHANTPERDFCTAVDTFCENPHAPKATPLNALYHTACLLAKNPSAPPELSVRIALIQSIQENTNKTLDKNLSTADLGSQKWTEKAPLPPVRSNKSSYKKALSDFKAETSQSKPTTLKSWVQLLVKDGNAKVAKYTAQHSKVPDAHRDMHEKLITDATSFTKAMTTIITQLDRENITEARETLQAFIATHQDVKPTDVYTKIQEKAQKKRLEVLGEMVQTCEKLDQGIEHMIAADVARNAVPKESIFHRLTHRVKEVPQAAVAAPTLLTTRTLQTLTDMPTDHTHTAPVLRAYDAGMMATTVADIDTSIDQLMQADKDSTVRDTSETTAQGRLQDQLNALHDKTDSLQELHTLVLDIPTAKAAHDAAQNALGTPPDATTGTAGSGLYLDQTKATDAEGVANLALSHANTEIAPLIANQRRLQTEVARLTGEINRKTLEKDAIPAQKQALTDEETALRDTTIPDLNRQIQAETLDLATLERQPATRLQITTLDAQIATLNSDPAALNSEVPAPSIAEGKIIHYWLAGRAKRL